eukprot:CAMPEP_0171065812 /NCGR_PEP_ID=MMETSP0766_2-20121228/7064_1 /TAXON_ID=439317 /ORGANISM="Gambierdiscus australes, Strain CAWD 149" /LENGTH=84 /DNA_ID=CAMNT_0011521945 /DNA_START=61 /DNA_END=312 /DNA_ORIENTATION=+
MASTRRPARLLLVAAAACGCCRWLAASLFVPAPGAASPSSAAQQFSPAVALSAALPAMTILADDAEAKYGDARKWSAILVPLTT